MMRGIILTMTTFLILLSSFGTPTNTNTQQSHHYETNGEPEPF